MDVLARERLLQVILVTTILGSLVHNFDNAVRIDAYRPEDPGLIIELFDRWVIALNWTVFTVVAVVGYRRFRQGRPSAATPWLGAYAASLIFALVHYTDKPFAEFTLFQNATILGEVVMGSVILIFALWTACSPGAVAPSAGRASRPLI